MSHRIEGEKPKGLRKEEDFLRTRKNSLEHTHLQELREEEGVTIYQGKTEQEVHEFFAKYPESKELKQFEAALDLSRRVEQAGGRALAVGGAVRDEIFQIPPKDIDIEIYGLEPEQIEGICNQIGKTDAVGRAFGIIKISLGDGAELDVSLPRVDSKIGVGHKGFTAKVDPHMSIVEAAKRRDFTINALAKNLLTGEIFDGYGGVNDARERILRVTDKERFQDDPLRVMRAAQFAARLGLEVEPESAQLISEMVPRLSEIPYERMGTEWKKLLLKSERPSLGLQIMVEWGIMREYYPELHVLRQVPQEFEWHPEGDVWIHTLMVVDEAVRIAKRENLDEEQTYLLVLSALCHDLGKATTTKYEEKKGEMRYTSHGHEPAGVEPTKTFLKKLGVNNDMIRQASALVGDHLFPGVIYREYQKGAITNIDKAMNHCAERIAPATLYMLTLVAEADSNGRGPFPDPKDPEQLMLQFGYKIGPWFRKEAQRLNIAKEKPRDILRGQELIDFGFLTKKDGAMFGRIISEANRLRDDLQMSKEDIVALMSRTHAQENSNAHTILDALRAIQEETS